MNEKTIYLVFGYWGTWPGIKCSRHCSATRTLLSLSHVFVYSSSCTHVYCICVYIRGGRSKCSRSYKASNRYTLCHFFCGSLNAYPIDIDARVPFGTRHQWNERKSAIEKTRTIRHNFGMKHDRQNHGFPPLNATNCCRRHKITRYYAGIRLHGVGFTCLRSPPYLFPALFATLTPV